MNPSALIWRADLAESASSAVFAPTTPEAAASNLHTTGWALLDVEARAGGGWPRAGLIELLAPWPQDPTWLLLAPWLARAGAGANTDAQSASPEALVRPIVCVNPPCEPYLPGLHTLGVAPRALLKIEASTQADGAWAVEQALQTQACLAVLWWTQDLSPASNTQLRRLHLAAQDGATPLFAVRPQAAGLQASPAPLRVAVDFAEAGGLSVRIAKRRGPAMDKPLVLATALQGCWPAAGQAQQATPSWVNHPRQPPNDRTHHHAVACPAPASVAA
jgi:protein ImuA